MPEDHGPLAPDVPHLPADSPPVSVPSGADGAPAEVSSPGHASGRIRRSADQARQRLAVERTRLQTELNTRRQRSGMVDAGFQVQELDARVGGLGRIIVASAGLNAALAGRRQNR